MGNDTVMRGAGLRVANWILLAMMVLIMSAQCTIMLIVRAKFVAIFADFGTKLPPLTLMYVLVPGLVAVGIVVMLSLIGVLLQLLCGRTVWPLVYCVGMMVFSAIALMLFIFAMFLPVSTLVNGVMQQQ